MKRIVLLRHGESLWNQENRFTGWTDVDLSEKGVVEACKAGDTLREAGFSFEIAYTSYLKRAIKTLDYVLDRLNESWIPVEKTWRLRNITAYFRDLTKVRRLPNMVKNKYTPGGEVMI